MPTFLRNKLRDLSEEMLCGSLQFLGIISLFLPCLQDPFPQISAVVSAENPVVSSMMTSKEERHWYLKHYLPWGSTTLWRQKSKTLSSYSFSNNCCSSLKWSGPFGLFQVQLFQSMCRLNNHLLSLVLCSKNAAEEKSLRYFREHPGSLQLTFFSDLPVQVSSKSLKVIFHPLARPREKPFFSLGLFCTPEIFWYPTKTQIETRSQFFQPVAAAAERLVRVSGLKGAMKRSIRKVRTGKNACKG